MGHHYVPQRYLRSFSVPGEEKFVWMFDEQTGKSCKAAIKQVAQESGFYDDDEEAKLNTDVEIPGARAIESLLGDQGITREERIDIARFVATMIKRVPKGRERANLAARHTLRKFREGLPERAAKFQKEHNVSPEEMERQIAAALALIDNQEQEYDPAVDQVIRTPFVDEEVINHFAEMTWRVLEAPKGATFITSDNPAVFLGEIQEFVLPLRPARALHGSFTPGETKLSLQPIPRVGVVEVNRRIAMEASRFCFHHGNSVWILNLMKKRHPLRPFAFPGQKKVPAGSSLFPKASRAN